MPALPDTRGPPAYSAAASVRNDSLPEQKHMLLCKTMQVLHIYQVYIIQVLPSEWHERRVYEEPCRNTYLVGLFELFHQLQLYVLQLGQ